MDSSKRAAFLQTYICPQNWPIPKSLIYQITQNPSTPEAYHKLIKSCKYFFVKNPILVVSHISVNLKLRFYLHQNDTFTFLPNTLSKFWITDRMSVGLNDISKANLILSISPKIYKSDITYLSIRLNIFYNDLVFLTPKCEICSLNNVTVINEDGGVVSLENIFKILPNITYFDYTFPIADASKIIKTETVQNLLELSNFYNLTYFHLINLTKTFHIETFYEYIMKNTKTRIRLEFDDKISEGYKNRIKAVVDEILANKDKKYKMPLIEFPAIEQSSLNKMKSIFYGS